MPNTKPNRDLLSAILDNSAALVVTLDRDGNVVLFNRRCEQVTGYDAKAIVGKPIWDTLIPPAERVGVLNVFRDLSQIGDESEYENDWLDRDGKSHRIYWSNSVIRDQSDAITHIVSVGIDLTESHVRDTRLHLAEAALASSLSAIAIADLNGILTYVNQSFLETWGLTGQADALGRFATDFWQHPEDASAVIMELQNSGRWEGHLEAKRDDGTNFTAELRASLLVDNDGDPMAMLASFRNITEQEHITNRLVQNERQLAEAQRIAKLGSWSLDLADNTLYWSDEIYRIFEIDPERFPASYAAFLDAIHPEDREAVNDAFTRSVKDHKPYRIEHRLQMSDGRIKWVVESGETIYADDGHPLRSVGTVLDISERRQTEVKMRQWAAVFENTLEGVMITDDRAFIIDVNKAFTDISGFSRDEAIGSKPSLRRSDLQSPDFYERLWAQLLSTDSWTGEIWNRKKNGEVSPEWMTITAIRDASDKVTNYVAVFNDISVLKETERKLTYLANHDPLTELPNRTLLMDRIEHTIAQARRSHGQVAVLFADLDRFKNVNDSLGHAAGDELLIQVANRLNNILRRGDTFGRLGGDEFLIVTDDFTTLDEVEQLARRLNQALTAGFTIHGQSIYIGVSIGISVYPTDGDDATTLVRNADAAMYSIKGEGRNDFRFYRQQLTEETQHRLKLEAALREGFDAKEFSLYFQPIVDLRSERVIGAEALLRWHHNGQTIPPDEFIPIAEESGLIVCIGEWVFTEACRLMMAWHRRNLHLQHLAINVSGLQLEKGQFAETVRTLLKECAIERRHFNLEITETVIMSGSQRIANELQALKAFGVTLSLDDFGTGACSLSNLKNHPFDMIKIDRYFVADMLNRKEDRAIVEAVIAMAKGFDIEIVGEGIEEPAQAQLLRELGCDFGQGYLFSKPLPVEQFEALLESEAGN